MLIPKLSRCFGLLLFIFIQTCTSVHSQMPSFNIGEWTQKLSSRDDIDNKMFEETFPVFLAEDSLVIFNILAQLEAKLPTSNLYYKARVSCFSAWVKFRFKKYRTLSEVTALAEKAVNTAYETNDKFFIAFINWLCGNLMINSQQLELAITYKLKTEEIYSKIGYPVYYDYIANWAVLGEALFHSRDYEQSIFYTKKALRNRIEKTSPLNSSVPRYYNTIAQDYEQLEKLDSAIVYLDTSLMFAEKQKLYLWKGISSGFKGEVLFKMGEYEKAKSLLEYDFDVNKNLLFDIAAKSLQWIARINLLEGKKDSALLKAKEALELIKKTDLRYYLQPDRYLEMCYFTLAEAFRATGKTDSFYYYNQLRSQLHDSLQNVAYLSSSRLVQLKINNENILRAVQALQKEKVNEVMKRNVVIGGLVLFFLILVLYVNRLRLKQRIKEQEVIQQKKMAESELALAKEQMLLFTQNIVEKTNLVEKLNQQLVSKEVNGSHQVILDELMHHTILTEADWDNFKMMFEKIHPGFFFNLKQRATDITIAEQRMAALTRLNLTAKQMGSILGISVDSVHKARQRLRQRLHVRGEVSLEETVSTL